MNLKPYIKHVTSLLLLLMAFSVQAQLYDKTWIVGNNCAKLTFETDTTITDTFNYFIPTYVTWASICNEQGDLQFFTTGFYIYDKNGDLMNSGVMLSDSLATDYWTYGLPETSGALILPRGNQKYYIINFSFSNQQMQNSPYAPDRLYYSTIDMSMFAGLGGLTSRRNLLYSGAMSENHLTACRHANGRDWWLIANKYKSNEYLKYLVTPDSIYGPYFQTIGSPYLEPDLGGQLVFSPSGEKFAGVTLNSQLVILDFDRCTGEFSNPVLTDIQNDTLEWSGNTEVYGGGGVSLEFSPNGRFLYLGNVKVIYQYDLTESDLAMTRKTIFKWDTSYGGALTYEMRLSPKGQILVSNFAGAAGKDFSLIKKPDLPDTLCELDLYNFKIPCLNSHFINNTFNYRLGKVPGSACDTIISGVDEFADEDVLQISPNPAKDKVEIQLAKYLPDAELLVCDIQGHIVYQNPHYYLAEYLNVQEWPAGVYFIRVSNNKKEVKGKFVKE